MKDTDFFLKLNIPNLPVMQKEVLDYLKNHSEYEFLEDVTQERFAQVSLSNFPTICSFFSPRAKNIIYETALRTVPPNFSSTIHSDGVIEDPDHFYRNQLEKTVLEHPDKSWHSLNWEKIPSANQFVLVIPISNYENSMNYWYDASDKVGKEVTHYYERNEFPYKFWLNFYTEADNSIPIEEVLIDRPTFIKADMYHNVKNYGTATRLVLTMRIFEYEKYSSLDQVFDYTGLV